ncbi:hypothetical protein X798_06423 [Onchocerca flexuosa]|uniref:Uncharacterized protein n=1 Tax=Onchocerca flexuosa TaxID=387005 RepID=A0A238BMA5_9BILA|nr:hypothetical protein X798_06423 [Onchocerca flexuosa]
MYMVKSIGSFAADKNIKYSSSIAEFIKKTLSIDPAYCIIHFLNLNPEDIGCNAVKKANFFNQIDAMMQLSKITALRTTTSRSFNLKLFKNLLSFAKLKFATIISKFEIIKLIWRFSPIIKTIPFSPSYNIMSIFLKPISPQTFYKRKYLFCKFLNRIKDEEYFIASHCSLSVISKRIKQKVEASRKRSESDKKGESFNVAQKIHDKIVDAYNPYYQYFDERYKIRVGRGKKKRRSPKSTPKKITFQKLDE